MLAKINIKKSFFALLFSVLLILMLLNTVESTPGKGLVYVNVGSSSFTELTVVEPTTDNSSLTHVKTAFEKGNKVIAFEPENPQLIQLTFSQLSANDTVSFSSLLYQRGNANRLVTNLNDLANLQVENGKLISESTFVTRNTGSLTISFSIKNMVESNLAYLLKRGLFYALLLAICFVLFYRIIPDVDHLSWLRSVVILSFSVVMGLGLYQLIDQLEEFPSRSVVDIKWDQRPGGIYGILPTKTPHFSDAKPVFINPNDPARTPLLLISRMDPLYALRIDVDASSSDYFIQSVSVKNALMFLSPRGSDLLQAFPLVNDAKLKIVTREGKEVLHFIPKGDDPYVIFYDQLLPFYRIIDRIVFRANLYLGFLCVVFMFCLLGVIARRYPSSTISISWFPFLFILLLFIPGLLFLFSSPTPYFPSEKRRTNSLAGIDTIAISAIPNKLENYISDHFGARSKMILADNMMSVVLFNETNEMSTVTIGDNDWMFYTGEGVKTAVRNEQPIDTATLESIRRNLLQRQHWIEAHGAKLFFAFPPMKPTVYEEFLPDDMKPIHRPSRMETIINYLKVTTNLKVIDLNPTIMGAKQMESKPLYYKRDTHWNHLGAFYGYQAIIDTLNNYFPEIGDPLTLENYHLGAEQTNFGDLSALVGLQDFLLREEVLLFPKQPCNCIEEFRRESPTIPLKYPAISFINKEPLNNLSLFFFRDSYANYFIESINMHFEENVYLWTYGFQPDAFISGYPDLVVYEVMERFISDLAIPNPPEVSEFYQNHLDTIEVYKPLPL